LEKQVEFHLHIRTNQPAGTHKVIPTKKESASAAPTIVAVAAVVNQ